MSTSKSQVIMITGAAGFLGSAAAVELSRRHHVVAIDRRLPSRTLREATGSVAWHHMDISDAQSLAAVFSETCRRFGHIDFVFHLAAFYHFGTDEHPEYERTNVQGTANVLRLAMESGVARLVFASSIAALLPGPHGEVLTERSPTSAYIPYGRSKGIGEQLVKDASARLPTLVLRIAGVFSSWCELPPLASVMKLWCGRYPMNRIVVGRGDTGIPYIHRDDFVRMLCACIDRNSQLARYEVLLASQHGSVSHGELFRMVWDTLAKDTCIQPIYLSPRAAMAGLHIRRVWGLATRDPPYERPWMLQYVDRPWVADTAYTRQTLAWDCDEHLTICQQLPSMIERYRQHRREWERRNRARTDGTYSYRL